MLFSRTSCSSSKVPSTISISSSSLKSHIHLSVKDMKLKLPLATSSTASASPTLQIVPSAGSYTYAGCYTEGSSSRALGSTSSASDTMTIESCVASCDGYAYAGTEYGRECYCGDSFSTGSVLTSDSDCYFTCSGSDFEYCGAGNRLSVYARSGAGSSGGSNSSSPNVKSVLPSS
jgi:hypothetical protein